MPAVIILVVVFAFRFLSFSGFPNDHFVYVARAQQILLGDWPVRDFADPGFFLMYVASAATQAAFGHNLLGEGMLVFGGFAIGAALTYGLARGAAGSAGVALGAVALQALAYPRSYSYPKLPLHALAILLCWSYLSRPTPGRRIGLGALTAIAFMFRPDHGVGIGLIALMAIAWADSGTLASRARTIAGFGAAILACLLPWLVLVQTSIGVPQYLASALGFTGRKAEVGAMGWVPFPFAAGAFNHEAFLYYAFWLLPIGGALVLWRRRDAAAPMPDATRRLALVIVLAVFANATLLRNPLANRLGDVGVPQAILAAWLLSAAWRAVRETTVPLKLVVRFGTAVVFFALALSTVRLGAAEERLSNIPILRPAAVVERARLVAWGLTHIDQSTGLPRPTDMPQLVSYLRACTQPDDRVMYVGYAPETYYFARRGFAGGHVVFEGGYNASPAEQALTVSRMQRERVPVIAMRESSTPDFRIVFTTVAAHIDDNYVQVGTLDLPSEQHEWIFVDRRLIASSVYEPLGLPCFAAN